MTKIYNRYETVAWYDVFDPTEVQLNELRTMGRVVLFDDDLRKLAGLATGEHDDIHRIFSEVIELCDRLKVEALFGVFRPEFRWYWLSMAPQRQVPDLWEAWYVPEEKKADGAPGSVFRHKMFVPTGLWHLVGVAG